jgi:hypothetical protein
MFAADALMTALACGHDPRQVQLGLDDDDLGIERTKILSVAGDDPASSTKEIEDNNSPLGRCVAKH